MGCDGLWLTGAVVVAEAVVGKPKRFGQHPAFTVVLGKKRFEAEALQILKSDLCKNCVAEFRGLFFVHAPKALGVE